MSNETKQTAVDWLAEQMNDRHQKQETFEEAVNNFKKTDVYINEIKQKQERSYSEEDMIEFSKWRVIYEESNPNNVKHSKKLLQMWFEQFKR
jgi:hypothetical protein